MAISKHSSQNSSGRYIDFANPQPDQFNYEDIAQGLSRECRFNGQTSNYYSVAQHSVLVSLLVKKEFALEALLHDGSEAFMRDICSPLKALLPNYLKIEREVQGAIHEHFGLPKELSPEAVMEIKRVDLLMTATERDQLMPTDDREWPGVTVEPLEVKILPMDPGEAKTYFMDRLMSIMEDRPFLDDIHLWNAQNNEWLDRVGPSDEDSREVRRARPAA